MNRRWVAKSWSSAFRSKNLKERILHKRSQAQPQQCATSVFSFLFTVYWLSGGYRFASPNSQRSKHWFFIETIKIERGSDLSNYLLIWQDLWNERAIFFVFIESIYSLRFIIFILPSLRLSFILTLMWGPVLSFGCLDYCHLSSLMKSWIRIFQRANRMGTCAPCAVLCRLT